MRRPVTAFALLYVLLTTGHVACAETFHLTRENGVLVLPVQINHSITLNFTIDSGASDVVIPQDVFYTLARTGTITSKDMLGSGIYELADGTRHRSRRFRIESLEIGTLELKGIMASVAPAGASLLLGQSFLSHLSNWSIDNERELLIVGGDKRGENADSPSEIQQAQSDIDKANKWIACTEPFTEKMQAANNYQEQLAIMYPRFGLLWKEWMDFSSRCATEKRKAALDHNVTEADAAGCGNDAFERTHADFINRVVATAEPEAVRVFNLSEAATRVVLLEMKQTCGSP